MKRDCPWPTEGQALHWTCNHRHDKHSIAKPVNLLPKTAKTK